jgi:hypothetical protein
MIVQTIQADSLPAALREVRRLVGPDAVVLHTRTVTRPRWWGLRSRRLIEIVAAPAAKSLPLGSGVSKLAHVTDDHVVRADGPAPAVTATVVSRPLDTVYRRLVANRIVPAKAEQFVGLLRGELGPRGCADANAVLGRLTDVVASLLAAERQDVTRPNDITRGFVG